MRYQFKKPISESVKIITLLYFFFQTLDEWSFDVFALSDAASSQPIKYLGYDLLNRYGMIHKFKASSLEICYFFQDLSTSIRVHCYKSFTRALTENVIIISLLCCYVVASVTYCEAVYANIHISQQMYLF